MGGSLQKAREDARARFVIQFVNRKRRDDCCPGRNRQRSNVCHSSSTCKSQCAIRPKRFLNCPLIRVDTHYFWWRRNLQGPGGSSDSRATAKVENTFGWSDFKG